MQLTGKQIAQIRDALLAAFDEDTLAEMVRVELNVTLAHVAGGKNLRIVVFNLVSWAEQHGRVEDLIQGACSANGGNAALKQLLADSQTWPAAPPLGAQASPPAPAAAVSAAPAPAASVPAAGPASIDIFLSYRRVDAEAMRIVQEVLRGANLSVWTDEGLEPGTSSWTDAIEEAIKQANAFVVLLSPAAKASIWVKNEIAYAQTHGKPIYPLLIAGDAGSAVPISLISTQWIDARQEPREAAERLLSALSPQTIPAPVPSPQIAPVAAGSRRTLVEHLDGIHSVVFSPDGKTLASTGSFYDNTVRLWDAATGELLRTIRGGTGCAAYSAVFSPDGKMLANGSDNGAVWLWSEATGDLLRTLDGGPGYITSIAFSPNGKMLAGGGSDKMVRLWNAATGEQVRILEAATDVIQSVVFSPDGKILASGGFDKIVRLWDATTGDLLRTLKGHTGFFLASVTSVAFSPDGKTLATGGSDRTVRLWDAATGDLRRTLRGHTGFPVIPVTTSVAFSPDGKILASGSDDKTVRLWDGSTGEQLRVLEGHTDAVYSVAFSPDGKMLASGSRDGTIRLWPVDV